MEFREDLLEDDFETLCQTLIESMEPQPVFMYRDFQSRNIMVKDGGPYLIDFQGGRKGPLYYDVASFLWQAKANYPDSLRQELIDEYLEALRPYKQIEKEVFLSRLRHVVLFRTLQVLELTASAATSRKRLISSKAFLSLLRICASYCRRVFRNILISARYYSA